MLSIIVDDTLNGVDVSKKYPLFYARMLADEALRTAFLETLELLEMSRNGQLPEYEGPQIVNLDFLHQTTPKSSIEQLDKNRWRLSQHSSFYQLQKMFEAASLQLDAAYRYSDLSLDDDYFQILDSRVRVGGQDVEIKVDVGKVAGKPESLNLMLVVFAAEELVSDLEATIQWGSYEETVSGNRFGLVHFPPIRTRQIFHRSGKIFHDLECHLVIGKTEK